MPGWNETYQKLSAADRETPLGPADLKQLAIAAYLTGRDAESFGLLIRAHQAFLEIGDTLQAVITASQIVSILLNKGDASQAAGWMARTDRLAAHCNPDAIERGYLLLPMGRRSAMSGDLPAAASMFAEAANIAERSGDLDLMNFARHAHGRALVELGEIERGVALLDEVMVAVTAGEVSPITAGIVYCSVLSVCWDMFDVGRAREWTEAFRVWCESQSDIVLYRGECLVNHAEIMGVRGVWSHALEEALLACERLAEPPGQPALAAAVYQVGELHRLRGDFESAELWYRRASDAGRPPYPGLALMRLAQGRIGDAAAAISRVLEETRSRRTRSRALAAAVEIMLARGDRKAARRAADELSASARSVNTPFLNAMAEQAKGAVLLDEGDAAGALTACRTAWTRWCELDVPYEAARTRVLTGLACRALGDEDSAALELQAARRAFDQLGATPDVARVDKLVDRPHGIPAGLTSRELEVLRLVAAGKSNRAIADALSISEKTVARHLSNIFTKLDVPSRAAATAYAFQHDLIDRST